MTKEITRELLKALREDMNAALQDVAKKHGLIIGVGNASFDAISAKFKVEIGVPAEGQTAGDAGRADIAANKAAADWAKYAKLYGCEPEWLGKSYQSKGKTMTVKGLMPGRTKNCVLLHDQNGKGFVIDPAMLRLQLARAV